MKELSLLLTAGVLTMALLTGCDRSASEQSATPTTNAPALVTPAADDATPSNTTCPVGGEPVDASGAKVQFAGKVYGFCCDDCIKAFSKDPAKYAAKVK